MTDTSPQTAAIIRELAISSCQPRLLDAGNIYAIPTPDGQVHQIDLTDDRFLEFPSRKRGKVTVEDVASFAAYYAKHADRDSEVFASLNDATVTAVLDAHRNYEALGSGDGDAVRWQEHRLVLQLRPTRPWLAWTGSDRMLMPQEEFAEFVEDNARDVAPDGRVTAADLLEIAQKFQAKTSVKFTGGKRLASGDAQFEYVEETTARAGDRGTIEIPTEFDLAIWPYEDCSPRHLSARFRYRLQNGDLRLGFFLNDPDRVAREAVSEIVGKLEAECGVTVMHGRPA